MVSLASLYKAMESVAFRDAALDKNIEAVKQGYEKTITFLAKEWSERLVGLVLGSEAVLRLFPRFNRGDKGFEILFWNPFGPLPIG